MHTFLKLSLYTFFLCQLTVVSAQTFKVSIDKKLTQENQDGRLVLIFADNDDAEPRFQVSEGLNAIPVYGKDVVDLPPGEDVEMVGEVYGFPIREIKDLESGRYYVQAVLNRYEDFHLATGQVVSLPPDKGEGQKWNRKPGNYYSTPRWIEVTDKAGIDIMMDNSIPAITPPSDSKYIKHIKIKSDLLTTFWGRDMFLGAHVLLPHGYDENPDARYPLMIFHGHFPYDFSGFRMDPPDENLKPEYSARFNLDGYNKIVQEEAHTFYKQWTSDDFPRFIVIKIQHATPYYDDSYAVNSASMGPYGDAITYELVPHIEKMFKGVGESWSRFLYGGSTGGWEAIAAQIFYPDEYGACFAACPDPIDFSSYCLLDIYNQENAYYYKTKYKEMLIPGHRDYLGQVTATVRDMNHLELALGTKTRSGQQFDIWEAVFSPQGPDGYPERLWNKETGVIDPEVAAYWKENYDLRHILERDWKSIGKKLEGKIHLYCGDMDNYYLNNAVYKMEAFLNATENPPYGGEVTYGDRAEHCWNGNPDLPNHITRLRYNTMYIPKIKTLINKHRKGNSSLINWD